MAELMAEIAANEYAGAGGGPLVQRAAQVSDLAPDRAVHHRLSCDAAAVLACDSSNSILTVCNACSMLLPLRLCCQR